MNLNKLTIIGYIGRNAETKQLPNGSAFTKFSIATSKSWKDDKGEWKQKTQWHAVLAFGESFAQLAPRLVKGAHVFVQGELTTREYNRTITVPTGKKAIEHVIQQLAVELKADTIRILDRASTTETGRVAEEIVEEDIPLKGGLLIALTSFLYFAADNVAAIVDFCPCCRRLQRASALFLARSRFSSRLIVAQ
jgi:single-strand DNA-binding protein